MLKLRKRISLYGEKEKKERSILLSGWRGEGELPTTLPSSINAGAPNAPQRPCTTPEERSRKASDARRKGTPR